MYKMVSSVIGDFTSLQIWMTFVTSCLMVLAKTFNTMLKEWGEWGPVCIIPDLSGKSFNLPPLSTINVFVIYVLIMLRHIHPFLVC